MANNEKPESRKKRVEDGLRTVDSVRKFMNEFKCAATETGFVPFETMRRVALFQWQLMGAPENRDIEIWLDTEHKIWGNTRKLIEDTALKMWDWAGQPYEMALDQWLAAERLLLSVNVAVKPHAAASSDVLSKLVDTLSVNAYMLRVKRLAELMWMGAGSPAGLSEGFWVAAEQHILTILNAALKQVETARDVAERFRATLESFSEESHLTGIRLRAYQLWENAGRPYGDTLQYWLAAETEFLRQIAGAS
ncbi:MAG: DUF2934 domain-containing protein [Candidatus Contendobacter sp.]|nr:DUF2934 domain-containing protein [Candidatus Contendobacter sp.]